MGENRANKILPARDQLGRHVAFKQQQHQFEKLEFEETFLLEKSLINACWNRLCDFGERHDPFLGVVVASSSQPFYAVAE